MLTSLLAFLGACTLIAATPGPSTVLIIRQSLQSKRAGMAAVLGNETGVFLWGVIAACGLTALLAASEVAYDVMRFVGAAVLLWFGVQALRAARRGGAEGFAEEGTAEPSPRRAYRTALVVNLANPKVGVFAMSFLPQFVPHGAPHLATTVALAAIWAVYEVAYYAVYVWGVQRLKGVLSRAGVRKRLEQICGTVLIALGVRLAADAR
ncbi:LysE family translocator [Streptomyces sp. A7024]|uniref:LysE family translocator n=1 Tax=Streptomyces coryli TaxID=1128680 RepID=A0A6G4U1Z3_9ACTN|nr:LysE family translocator [Streptomyces coryli]NGN65726.1 LysE family translocator [Streptomyces coryli]